jgi:hypothetical protein
MKLPLGHLLASSITTVLMKSPGLRAEDIRGRIIKSQGKNVTIQGIYKELRRLQESQIAFKSNDLFYLSLPWLLESKNQIEQSLDIYTKLSVLKAFLPTQGETLTWRFSEIHAMDRLVVNLMVSLLSKSETKEIYHWDPYPWYAVFHADLAEPFLNEFTRAGFSAYGIIGANSPISERVVRTQKPFGHQWWIGKPPFAYREDLALSVNAPFILSIRYPVEAVKIFRKIFSSKSALGRESLASFHQLSFTKLEFKVTLQHNTKRAQTLVNSFKKVFFT